MDKTNWTVEENVPGKFTALEAEEYWEKLRIHFIREGVIIKKVKLENVPIKFST
jgi:hypothetical protein